MKTDVYKRLINTLDQGSRALMLTILHKESLQSERYCLTEKDVEDAPFLKGISAEALLTAREALRGGRLGWQEGADGSYILAEPSSPEPKLLVLGGGHIAKPLVGFGAKLGFQVTVCDDRPAFANEDRFPDAQRVICESFENCFQQVSVNASTFVVIITRGHRHDMDCFRKVAKCEMAYVGMIGSRRRIVGLKAQLLEEGYSTEQLDRLHAPIGLAIGAVTPEEIALSIIAQVVSVRRTGIDGAGTVNSPELNVEVLEELSVDKEEPRAIVTVIGTKGSVPRKEGAKMVVWPYGRTLGSIGGGCSESEVIGIARDMIQKGGFYIHRVDMTGQVAEDEGMVCGGIMDVLIEAY